MIIRQALTERLAEGRYGTRLDALIGFLSQMGVRRMVPGRIYSHWGLGGFDTVTLQLLAMLLANVPEEGDNGVIEGLGVLAANEELFAGGDAVLRRIGFDIESVRRPLCDQANYAALERGTRILAPGKDFAASVTRLRAILAGAGEIIQQRRTDRLLSLALDAAKMAALRDVLENALVLLPRSCLFSKISRSFEHHPLPAEHASCPLRR